MSKIGKQPIEIKDGVTVTLNNKVVTVTGTKGTLTYTIPEGITVIVENGQVLVSVKQYADTEKVRGIKDIMAKFGLVRSLIANMVTGVSDGFEKRLELSGVGYRAQSNGSELTLSLGFAHPVKFKAPEGVTFAVAENNVIVSGANKEVVGNTAAHIRAVKPPEPYKGKGISYKGEKIRRKAGKSAKAVGGK